MGLQNIYDALKAGGLTRWGALAVMGNLQAESGNEAIRVEGDFDPSRRVSKAYAESVDSGKKTRSTYAYDERGWGLAQWTFWSRKQGLYDLCKAAGKSIGDETCQIQWLFEELKAAKYASLLAFLKTCDESQCYEATKRFCEEFERPRVNNVQTRYGYAQNIAKQVVDGQPEPEPEPEPAPEPKCWPPRGFKGGKDDPGLCIGMSGVDVELWQVILKAHGYPINYVSGKFDDLLRQATMSFQEDNGLAADGIVGPKSWAKGGFAV